MYPSWTLPLSSVNVPPGWVGSPSAAGGTVSSIARANAGRASKRAIADMCLDGTHPSLPMPRWRAFPTVDASRATYYASKWLAIERVFG